MPGPYDFGTFHLDAEERLLLREGRPVSLPPKAFDLLVELVDHAGHLRSKRDLMDRLWPGTFVEEANLSYTISTLRRALGDDRGEPRYVETVPTKGYRFVGDVTINGTRGAASPVASGPAIQERLEVPLALLSHVPANERRPFARRRAALVVGSLAALVVGIAGALTWWQARPPAVRVTSIAVLPFEDKSGGPEYFADGLTDELITEIGRRARLEKVINRRSAMRYRGSPKSNAEIARELGVDALFIGSVLRSGNTVRLTAQLVDPRDDHVLWAGRFERPLSDVLVLQRDLVRDVIDAVNIDRLPQSGVTVAAVDPQAYDVYLRGLAAFNEYSGTGLLRAPMHFREAIRRDPRFARAYAALAVALMHKFMAGLGAEGDDREVRQAIRAAVSLDAGSGEAQAARGLMLGLYEWKWKDGGQALRHAVDIAPNSPLVHLTYSHHLALLGRVDAAIDQARLALALDPTAKAGAVQLCWALHFAGRAEEFLAMWPRCRPLAGDLLSGAAQYFENLHEARLGRAGSVCARSPGSAFCGFAWARSGNLAEARRVFRRACSDMDRTGTTEEPAFCPQLAAAMGDREPLLAVVEQRVATRSFMAAFLRAPELGGLLEHEPRYDAALRQVGLSE